MRAARHRWYFAFITVGVLSGAAAWATPMITSASSSAPANTTLVIANTGFGVPAVTYTLDFPTLTPISIFLDVNAAGPYLLHAATLNIKNDSGVPWTTFDIHVSSTLAGSYFTSAGYNFPSATYIPTVHPTDIFFEGATISSGSSTVLQAGVQASGAGTLEVDFIPNATSPAVPEPASASIVAIGLLLGGWVMRRSRVTA